MHQKNRQKAAFAIPDGLNNEPVPKILFAVLWADLSAILNNISN
ncbi:hypothetical protein LDG_5070 [Legionella drancourtii LLAP12]|uniref:Uncharacterized protein n=1 Tax=Legionella drancourtii LLAP12 TaxID=658187 RepID=G9EIR4_9GAMM|nr:hypothetical protein LDG_5070 [Legionella drancourtii LLAP12]